MNERYKRLMLYWPVYLGLASLLLPTIYDVNQRFWQTSQNAHGPIVLMITIWAFYRKISDLIRLEKISFQPSLRSGLWLLAPSLLIYAVARAQYLYSIEVAMFIPILIGLTFIFIGLNFAARLWFPFFFLFFLIPLPGTIIDAITLPLKILVSVATEHILYTIGYPVARNGVIIGIGTYKLMVADACSGLNSLFSLEALGLLYLNMKGHQSVFRNTLLAFFIIPISFCSNVTRVIMLALITYYMGEEAGQGFLHSASSLLMFTLALILIISVDLALDKTFKKHGW